MGLLKILAKQVVERAVQNLEQRVEQFNEQKEEILEFREVFIGLCHKVDTQSLIDWNYMKGVDFLSKVYFLFQKNQQTYRDQLSDLNKLLNNEPLYIEAAYVAKDVYFPSQTVLKGNWIRSTDFKELPFCDEKSGLISALYERTKNSSKEYIYAVAGTRPKNMEDWKNNLSQLYGKSSQYSKSAEIAGELMKRVVEMKASLTFVGHSLGGGIAINNALQTGLHAIVFNPAGLSKDTLSELPKKYSDSDIEKLVTVFLAADDILNCLQDASQFFDGMKQVIPSTFGKRYYLCREKVSFKGHSMERMIEDLESVDNLNA